MIPIPVHIQRQLSKGIESLDFGGEKIVVQPTDSLRLIHNPPFLSLIRLPRPHSGQAQPAYRADVHEGLPLSLR